MRAKIRVAALTTAGVLGMGGLVAASAPPTLAAAPTVRIRVTGIGRNGHSTKLYAVITGTTCTPIYTSGTAVSVPKGPAWVGAEVDTTMGSQLMSATLVMRRVTVSRSQTIVLDARPGKLVKVSLDVAGAQLTGRVVQACIGGEFVTGPPIGAGDDATPLYVVPVRAKGFGFGYDSTWQTTAATRARIDGARQYLVAAMTLYWYFRTSPEQGVPLDAKLMPVTATRFVPRGLNPRNQATPGAATVVEVSVVRPGQSGYISPPRYSLRTVRVQASVDGSRTWQTVKLVRHGGNWLATVHDPASGYVALRSTLIDSRGNKSVETIYRAYAISGGPARGS